MKIHPPSENLGCLGFRLHKSLYLDFYLSPQFGCFINLKDRKLWLHLNGFKLQGYKKDILFRISVKGFYPCKKHLIVH